MSNSPDDLADRLRHGLRRGVAPELSSEIVTGAAHRDAPRIITSARRAQLVGGASALAVVAVIGGIALGSATPRSPLFTAAQGGPTSGARSSDAGASSDMRIGLLVDYRYSAGAGLSSSGGRGSVYQLVRAGSAETRAADIAARLGLAGIATRASYSDPAYPTWVVGAEDGSAPSVSVIWAGTGDWWYSDPAASAAYACEVTDAAAGDAPAQADIEKSAPQCSSGAVLPIDSAAPTESEARGLARKLFADTGLDVAQRDVRVTSDASQTTASANLVVDGIETALEWGVSWSSTGAISSAYGHSIRLVDRGSYDTISATAAVDRIANGRWYGAAGPAYQGDFRALAADGTQAVDPGAEPAPSGDPQVDPPPQPSPAPVQVTLERAESTLLLLRDSTGDGWLVPGFAMQVPQQWWTAVVSLVPGVIELAQPITISPGEIDSPLPSAP